MPSKLEKAERSIDQGQRIQFIWERLPTPVRGAIWTGLVSVGGWVAGMVSNLTVAGMYAITLGSGLMTLIGYAVLKNLRPDTHHLRGPVIDAEVVSAAPELRCEVTGGRSNSHITVRNSGRAFKMVARAQIVDASELIDRRAPYQFAPRDVEGSDGASTYTLATVNETTPPGISLKIRGEGMEEVQYWHQRFDDSETDMWCDIQWSFLELVGSDLKLVHSATTRVRLIMRDRSVSVELDPSAPAEPQLPPASASRAVITIDTLTERRKFAVHHLLNRPINSESELETLKQDISNWEKSVIPPLKALAAPDEVMDFEVLTTYAPRVVGGFNQEHQRELAMLYERMERLKRVIKRLGRR